MNSIKIYKQCIVWTRTWPISRVENRTQENDRNLINIFLLHLTALDLTLRLVCISVKTFISNQRKTVYLKDIKFLWVTLNNYVGTFAFLKTIDQMRKKIFDFYNLSEKGLSNIYIFYILGILRLEYDAGLTYLSVFAI